MKKQYFFFGNIFATSAALQLQKFGRSSIGRLAADHPARSARLKPKLEAFEQEAGLGDSAERDKQGHVASADEQLAGFRKYVKVAEGAIRYAAGEGWKKSELYRDFFPNGMTEYGDVNKTTMAGLAERLRLGAVKHAALLPAEVTTRLQRMGADWAAAFNRQESGKEQVEEQKAETGAARAALELALLTEMHEVAALHPGDVAACSRYFDLRLLKARTAASEAAGAAPAV
ncbi:hypothetical protein EPD60_16170 [Flaviaesturariibacter flavus]|uniref:Uncharacterized protein n=1 Tax=Flaviaesturariibacter flavus TaxID=2502780 RepID=A0A4R1B2N0_9BACT|nr:hypothetical protein [Flaviaesturariibacter flavus]TCJ12091.1 hypothetical protein EPD60_16170 [Flaviaesturariibacter flavus]